MNGENNNRLVRLIPNGLTLGRLILTVVFLVMVLYAPQKGQEKPAAFFMVAFNILVVAGLTDKVDG